MIPKFRAHDKRTNKIHDVKEIDYTPGFEGVYFDVENEHHYRRFEVVDIMQSIGLKDINGIDIFCGDIVKDFQGKLFLVKYWSEYSSYFLSPITELDKPMGIYPDIILEVIGDIYNNPELLKE